MKRLLIFFIIYISLINFSIAGNKVQIIGNKGKVELLSLSQNIRKWRFVKFGDFIDIKDRVRTGKDGEATINFRDYNFILMKKSLLVISSVPNSANNILRIDVKYGKLRIKSVTENSNKHYTIAINTRYSVVQLKGTDLVIETPISGKNNIYVFEGQVLVDNKNNPGNPVKMNANQMVSLDKNSVILKPQDIPDNIYKEYNIAPPEKPVEMKPAETPKPVVEKPKVEPKPQVAVNTNKKPEKKIKPKPKEKPKAKPKPKKPAPKPEKKEPWCKNPHLEFKFNMDMQYLNINNNGFMLIALMPELGYCKIGVGFYLPIIFSITTPNDFFYSKRWYNHNEWDFMSFSDSLHDLAIKIIYIRYGHKGDPLYARIGSLPSVTFGNGFIMNQYSNMLDFPTVRRIGLEFGYIYNHLVGIELFSSDITKNKLLAYRLKGFPLGWNKGAGFLQKLEIGQTFVIDKEAASSGENKVINWGFDLGLPLLATPILNLRYGIDWATYSVYSPISLGKQEWQGSGNWGFTTGFKGNLLMLLYKAEYRYLKDNYIPEYFDSFYEVSGMRDIKFASLIGMYSSTEKNTSNGYLVDIGFKIFGAGAIGANYQEYYYSDNSMDNKAQIYLTMKKGVVPLFYGTASYNKLHVVGLTGTNGLFGSLYNANTILTFDGGIKLISIMYIKVFYQKTFYYDSLGNLQSNVTYSLGMNLGF